MHFRLRKNETLKSVFTRDALESCAQPNSCLCLEERILYSASPLDGLATDIEASLSTADPDIINFFEATDSIIEGDHTPFVVPNVSDPTDVTSLVLIDEGLDDVDVFLRELSALDQTYEVHLINSQRDGIDQVSEILASYDNRIESLHILSHSADGQFSLGSTVLSSQNLLDYRTEISGWSDKLTADADLLVYGCDLAKSEVGQEFLSNFAQLADVDISASEDITGHSELGGDWSLEFQVGEVESSTIISAELRQQWMQTLATYTVNSTADDGSVGTLRWAIDQANANGGADNIVFNIPDSDGGHFYYRDDGLAGSLSLEATTTLDDASISDFDPDYPFAPFSWFRIDLDDSLPGLNIDDEIHIDGYSQPGATPNSLLVGHNAQIRIELTNSAADSNRGLSFNTGANGSSVQGLNINGFGSIGILVNYDVDDLTIQGNFIGTDITGTQASSNDGAGIQVRSSNNLIGGSNVEDRNVVSGNDNRGVVLFSFGTLTNNRIENNYIGVDSTGLEGLKNSTYGIQLWNDVGTQVIDNVISANGEYGILFRTGSQTHDSVIQGNMIGVGADGVTLLGNELDGIRIESDSATGNRIGGQGVGEGNVIAGNVESGIVLDGSSVSGTIIEGNSIGTDASGTLNLGNLSFGVLIENGAAANTIGGITGSAGNQIAFNHDSGIAATNSAGNRNAFLGNSIYANLGLGIDLDDDGVTDNDDFDVDAGANTGINTPTITAATTDGGTSVTLSGWFNTTAAIATYRLEFFSSATNDTSGHGEGRTFIGSIDVTTDSSGLALFNTTFTTAVAAGVYISATATDPSLNTSEFGESIAAALPGAPLDGVLLSTRNNVSGSGAPGLDDWNSGEVLQLGGPGLTLDPGLTNGSFSSYIDLAQFGADSVGIDALHSVTQSVTIGSGVNSINLVAGDVLFSTRADEVFFGGTFAVEANDLILFRPEPGTYSIGKMSHVLDMDSPALSVPSLDPELNFANLRGVSLVEQDVTLGGTDLFAGDILYSRTGGTDINDIFVFRVTDAGQNVTDGTAERLIEGSDLGFSEAILGLDLIERSIAVGDETLAQGELLISINDDTTILDVDANPTNDLLVNSQDIVALTIDQTELNGGTVASSARLFLEGDDVNLDEYEEDISAFTLTGGTSSNSSPTSSGIPNLTVDEDATDRFFNLHLAFDDAEDNDADLVYTITSVTDPSLFNSVTITAADFIQLDFAMDQNGSSFVTVRATDTGGLFVESTFEIVVNPINDDPFVAAPTGTIFASEDAANTTIDLTAVFDDVDILTNGDVLSYSIDSNSNIPLATSSIFGSNLILDYQDDRFGSSSIVVRATDSLGRTVTDTIFVNVASVNDAPILPSQTFIINENSPVASSVGMIIASPGNFDSLAGDSITGFAVIGGSGSSYFAVNSSTGEITVTDNSILDYETFGPWTLDVQVSDAGTPSLSATNTITIQLSDVAESPTLTLLPTTVDENQTLIGFLGAFDQDNYPLTFVITGGDDASLFTLDPVTGQLSFVAATDFEVPIDTDVDNFYQLQVTVMDAAGLTDSRLISIEVTDVAEVPPPVVPPTVNPSPDSSDSDDDNEDLLAPPPNIIRTDNSQITVDDLPSKASSFTLETTSSTAFVLPIKVTPKMSLENENSVFAFASLSSVRDRDNQDRDFGTALSFQEVGSWLWQDLDRLKQEMSFEGRFSNFWSVTAPGVTATISVGYAMWLLKGGQILAGLIAQVPAWQLIAVDPLPIIRSIDEDDLDVDKESLASMVDDANDHADPSTADSISHSTADNSEFTSPNWNWIQ